MKPEAVQRKKKILRKMRAVPLKLKSVQKMKGEATHPKTTAKIKSAAPENQESQKKKRNSAPRKVPNPAAPSKSASATPRKPRKKKLTTTNALKLKKKRPGNAKKQPRALKKNASLKEGPTPAMVAAKVREEINPKAMRIAINLNLPGTDRPLRQTSNQILVKILTIPEIPGITASPEMAVARKNRGANPRNLTNLEPEGPETAGLPAGRQTTEFVLTTAEARDAI